MRYKASFIGNLSFELSGDVLADLWNADGTPKKKWLTFKNPDGTLTALNMDHMIMIIPFVPSVDSVVRPKPVEDIRREEEKKKIEGISSVENVLEKYKPKDVE
jgi:hypothetical protein